MSALPASGQPPPVSIIHLAMVQGAVYDADNGIVGGYEPYLEEVIPKQVVPAIPVEARNLAATPSAR